MTFLGAQEISSSQPLEQPVSVSSGGFGPMVQPGQAVANYTIAPDGDDDGVGELVVINTASVAPNGDVVSDPVPQLQLGAATSTGAFGTQALESLQAGTLSGPPGTFIEIEATGFNQFSAFGNVAIFESLVDGAEIELPALVNSHFEDENAVPTIGAYIPPLLAGPATLTLKNVSTNETTAPIAITVETPPALTEEPAVLIDRMLTDMAAALSEEPELQGGISKLEEARTTFAELSSSPTPAEAQALTDVAVFISNSGISEVLSRLEGASSGNLNPLQQCDIAGLEFFTDLTVLGGFSMVIGVVLLGLGALTVPASIPLAYSAGLLVGGGSVFFGAGVGGLLNLGSSCLNPPPQACLPPYTNGDLAPLLPASLRAQQASAPIVTGMGSVFPPGGDGCGSAIGGAPANSGLGSSQVTDVEGLFGDLAGRFIVKVLFGGSSVVPFTGVSDSSGYFYVPTIPAGQPFEAIAFDTLTGETRSFEGIGPEVGTSTYMFFDFLSEGEGAANVINYDSNTEGVLDGLDIFLFEGQAGDIINLAWITDGEASPFIGFHLTDADGRSIVGSNASFTPAGYHETGLVELELDGLYTLTLDSGTATRNYTLGLSQIEPAALDVTAPLLAAFETLGDIQYFSFDGEANDTLDVTLSHEASSSLNLELTVLKPSSAPFHEPHDVLFNRETDDDRRTTTVGPISLPEGGEYLLELHARFDDELTKHLGTYQVDLSLTR